MSSKISDLSNILVMSKLGDSIEYTQVKTRKQNWQIIAICGIPFEYRLVSMLMISYASGGIASEVRQMFSDDTKAMWLDVKYQHSGPEIKQKINDDSWFLPNMFIRALEQATDCDMKELNMVTIARIVSHALHRDVTL